MTIRASSALCADGRAHVLSDFCAMRRARIRSRQLLPSPSIMYFTIPSCTGIPAHPWSLCRGKRHLQLALCGCSGPNTCRSCRWRLWWAERIDTRAAASLAATFANHTSDGRVSVVSHCSVGARQGEWPYLFQDCILLWSGLSSAPLGYPVRALHLDTAFRAPLDA